MHNVCALQQSYVYSSMNFIPSVSTIHPTSLVGPAPDYFNLHRIGLVLLVLEFPIDRIIHCVLFRVGLFSCGTSVKFIHAVLRFSRWHDFIAV